MKKIVSLLLALSMIVSMLISFTSCDAFTLEDIENDPFSALSDSLKESLLRFFDDDYGIDGIVSDALEHGSTEVSFSSELLGEVSGVTATLYSDKKESLAMASLVATLNGTPYGINAHLSQEGMILDSELLFGTSGAIAILYDSFRERFEESDLAKYLEMNKETIAKIKTLILSTADTVEESFTEAGETVVARANEFLALLKQTITAETLNDEACAVITYTVDNDVILAVAEKAMTLAELTEDEKEAMRRDLALDTLDSRAIDLEAKVYVSLADGYLLKASLTGSAGDKGDETPGTLEFSLTFSDEKIALVGSYTADGEPVSMESAIHKTVGDINTRYTFSTTTKIKGKEFTVSPLSFSYNRENRTFKLTLDMLAGEATLKGAISSSRKEAKIAITDMEMGLISLSFDLSVTFRKGVDVPEAPENTRDIVDMTEAEWEATMANVNENPVVKWFAENLLPEAPDTPGSDFGGSDTEEDDDPWFDFDFGDLLP
ncbi:MAG: hypothetical protein IKC63_03155 [Clostridia bacterium]|nr:hypothetical protein [Clostridia bacterium]